MYIFCILTWIIVYSPDVIKPTEPIKWFFNHQFDHLAPAYGWPPVLPSRSNGSFPRCFPGYVGVWYSRSDAINHKQSLIINGIGGLMEVINNQNWQFLEPNQCPRIQWLLHISVGARNYLAVRSFQIPSSFSGWTCLRHLCRCSLARFVGPWGSRHGFAEPQPCAKKSSAAFLVMYICYHVLSCIDVSLGILYIYIYVHAYMFIMCVRLFIYLSISRSVYLYVAGFDWLRWT